MPVVYAIRFYISSLLLSHYRYFANFHKTAICLWLIEKLAINSSDFRGNN